MALAPIALFLYRRPHHARRTLEALRACPEFASSPLHIYCDGPKSSDADADVRATRRLARELAPASAVIVERDRNWGLARSIIAGTTELCERYGKVIVVEDDLEVSPTFLSFLNAGLDRYADDERVMQVSGYQFPVDLEPSALFLSWPTSWGWATWQRAWKHFDPEAKAYERIANDPELRRRFDLDDSYPYFAMLEAQRRGQVDSWAIRWHLSVFVNDGLVLYPGQSLVRNTGFDGSGTHTGVGTGFAERLARPSNGTVQMPEVAVDQAAQRRIFSFLAEQTSRTTSRRVKALAASWTRTILQGAPLMFGHRMLDNVRHWRAARVVDACGAGTVFRGNAQKRADGSRIEIGDGCLIEGTLVCETPGSTLTIGSNVYVGGETTIATAGRIIVEDDVLISYQCLITDSDNHSLRYSERKDDLRNWLAGRHDWSRSAVEPVRICKGAWLGARVIVTKGVTIGEGAVCGTGAVVTKDVAPYTVVAGNPARVIKELPVGER